MVFIPSDENIDSLRERMEQEEYDELCCMVSKIFDTKKRINKKINSYGLKYTLEAYMKANGIQNYYSIDELFVCLYDTFIDLKYRRESLSKRNPNVNYLFNIEVNKPYKVYK